mgnify:CR=1 FL=1
MKQIILALILAVAGIGAAVAANPIREGNMISGHVLVKGSEENIPLCIGNNYVKFTLILHIANNQL